MKTLLIVSMLIVLGGLRAVAAEPAKPATLPASVAAWIEILEKSDDASAAREFVKDDKAAESMKRYWANLKQAHAKHDYRKWMEAAEKVTDDQKFLIGGHNYNHMHVTWEKTDAGWKIGNVMMCR